MTIDQISVLVLATAGVAALLVAEHYLVRYIEMTHRWAWAPQWNYALGLVTDAGGILLAAGLIRLSLDAGAAGVLLACMCLAGVPNFLLRCGEQAAEWQVRRRALARLAETNRALAAELALLKLAGSGRHYSRAHDLVEGIQFILGEMHRSRNDIEILSGQLRPLLEALMAGREGGEGGGA